MIVAAAAALRIAGFGPAVEPRTLSPESVVAALRSTAPSVVIASQHHWRQRLPLQGGPEPRPDLAPWHQLRPEGAGFWLVGQPPFNPRTGRATWDNPSL